MTTSVSESDVNSICTSADLGSLGIEPCRKLEKLVKR